MVIWLMKTVHVDSPSSIEVFFYLDLDLEIMIDESMAKYDMRKEEKGGREKRQRVSKEKGVGEEKRKGSRSGKRKERGGRNQNYRRSWG